MLLLAAMPLGLAFRGAVSLSAPRQISAPIEDERAEGQFVFGGRPEHRGALIMPSGMAKIQGVGLPAPC
jgi:hypothetical protein